jgi:replication factor C subunit 3/5
MSLWVDRNRPNSLAKLSLHNDISSKLRALAESEEIPHLLFYGPPGAGKKTRVMALLREIYGPGAEKLKLEHRSIKTNSGKTIELATVGSNYHIECNPSDAGNNDRYVIQEVIKEIASNGNLQSAAGAPGSRSFKIGNAASLLVSCCDNILNIFRFSVLLTEADRLSKRRPV